MENFSSQNLREVRKLSEANDTLLGGVDISTGKHLLLRLVTTDSQLEKSRDVGSLGIPHVSAYVSDFDAAEGKVLVFYNPEQVDSFLTLLPGETPLAVPRVLEIGNSLIACLEGVKAHGYYLKSVSFEDVIVSRETNKAYLINLDNVEPIIGKPSNKAEADIARLLMQLSLNCSFELVSKCIRRGKDGRYRLYFFPRGLDKRVRALIKALIPFSVSRLARRWSLFSLPVASFLIGVGVALSRPKPTWIEARSWVSVLTEATKDAEKRFRLKTCLYAIENTIPGDCRGVNLTGEDLSGKDLREIDLKEAHLVDTNLTDTNLSGMVLEEVNFNGAIFQGANLSGITAKDVTWGTSNLDGANLSEADLTHSDFSKAFLGEVNLDWADVSHAKFSGVNLSNQTLYGITAKETIFDGANLHGVTLDGGWYIGASFRGIDMGSAIFTGDVLIDDSRFRGAELAAARFIGAVVYSSSFYGSNLDEVVIDGSELSGTSFIESNLDNATVTDSAIYGGRFQDSSLRFALISASSVQAMDFDGVKARGLEIVDSDLSRSSNIPSYLFFGVSYRNVVMPNGEVRD